MIVVITSAYVYINDWPRGLIAFGLGVFLLALNGRIPHWRLFLAVLFVAMSSRLIGNAVFSPQTSGGIGLWIVRFNRTGLLNGVVGALRYGAILTSGYAAISCTTFPEYYEGLAFYFRKQGTRKWIVCFFRYLRRLAYEVNRSRQGLLIRGFGAHWYQLSKRVRLVALMLEALIVRFFWNVGRTAFTGETRWASSQANLAGSIEIRNLSVWYDAATEPALNGINLTVAAGDFVILGGQNGAGKSTLFRAITGYIPGICGRLEGEIRVDTENLTTLELSKIAEKVRYVSEDAADSIAGLTVGQDISLATPDEAEARRCLGAMDIADLWDRETSALSGGQQTRLALASVLAAKPAVLLLDSPLEQLDADGRREFMRALLWFRYNCKTTILVTDKFLFEFLPYANRLILLSNGRITDELTVPLTIANLLRMRADLDFVPACEVRQSPPSGLVAELIDIHVQLGGNDVLKGINLKISSGELVVVTGPNGSGKSTTLAILAGLLRPERGKVHSKVPVRSVFQEAELQIVKRSVGEELQLGPQALGWHDARATPYRTQQLRWLGCTGVEETMDLHPSLKRLLVFSGMLTEVGLLLLDEPTVGLDGDQVNRLIGAVRWQCEAGVAVVAASHDSRLIQVAPRIVNIVDGRILMDGSSAILPIGVHQLETVYGECTVHAFAYGINQRVVLAVTNALGLAVTEPLVRIQFGCVFGTALRSIDCDCGLQIDITLRELTKDRSGILLYFPDEEGEGHGLAAKIRRVLDERLAETGPWRVAEMQGLEYANYNCLSYVPAILKAIGVTGGIRLRTNSPQKVATLAGNGLNIMEVLSIEVDPSSVSQIGRMELLEKLTRLGHSLRGI
jgi:energy-coupling factor transport system ATP-binding protein